MKEIKKDLVYKFVMKSAHELLRLSCSVIIKNMRGIIYTGME